MFLMKIVCTMSIFSFFKGVRPLVKNHPKSVLDRLRIGMGEMNNYFSKISPKK